MAINLSALKNIDSLAKVFLVAGGSGGGKTQVLLDEGLLQYWKKQIERAGRVTEAERSLLEHQIFVEAERLAREQQQIESELLRAESFGDWQLVEQRRNQLEIVREECWTITDRAVSRILVRGKGTERSGSRNGAQTCCTHVLAIYESDAKARWLIGLLPKLDRAVRSVRKLRCIVSAWATFHGRRVHNSNFELCTT